MNTDKRLLQEAVSEIRGLRRQNEVLGARLSGFDDALLLLKTPVLYQSQGMGEDLAYKLEKRVAEIEQEEKRHPQAELSEDRKSEISTAMERKLRQ